MQIAYIKMQFPPPPPDQFPRDANISVRVQSCLSHRGNLLQRFSSKKKNTEESQATERLVKNSTEPRSLLRLKKH